MNWVIYLKLQNSAKDAIIPEAMLITDHWRLASVTRKPQGWEKEKKHQSQHNPPSIALAQLAMFS